MAKIYADENGIAWPNEPKAHVCIRVNGLSFPLYRISEEYYAKLAKIPREMPIYEMPIYYKWANGVMTVWPITDRDAEILEQKMPPQPPAVIWLEPMCGNQEWDTEDPGPCSDCGAPSVKYVLATE
jgi:hypothetical protein